MIGVILDGIEPGARVTRLDAAIAAHLTTLKAPTALGIGVQAGAVIVTVVGVTGDLPSAAHLNAWTGAPPAKREHRQTGVRPDAPGSTASVAYSLLVSLYHMLREGAPHQDLGPAHFDHLATQWSCAGPSVNLNARGTR